MPLNRAVRLTEEEIAWLHERRAAGGDGASLADAPPGGADAPPGAESLTVAASGDGEVITSRSRTIRDLPSLLAAAKVDMAVWEVERHVINKWDSVARVGPRRGGPGCLAATELWQVKAWLRRRVPKSLADAAAGIMERMGRHAPKYPRVDRPRKIADPHAVVLGLYDHHFGKMSWAAETGENYDLRIAERLYRHAGEELVRKAAGFPVERFVLPVGQDFFHIDGPGNTTTNGTPQDVDGRWAKIFTAGHQAVVGLIDYLLPLAPVDVLWVPGNHDWVSSFHLVKCLEAWYRNVPSVAVDASPTPRKCVEYGTNLLGFTHGNEEKFSSLPGIMAGSWPEAWARTTCREWLLGHHHRVRQTHYAAADTIEGVTVRVLPSLSGTDGWHFKRGFIGAGRAAQAFVYSRADGYAGHFAANAPREAYQ